MEGRKYQLDIWDTAGQEQNRSLGKHLYKDSFNVIFILFHLFYFIFLFLNL